MPVQAAKESRRAPLLLLAIALFLAGVSVMTQLQAGATAADREQEKKQKLEEVRRKIGELRTSIEGARDQQSQLRDELRATEVTIGDISRALRRIADEQKAKAETLRGLRARRAEAEAALDRQRRLLEQQIVAAYTMGRQGQLKIVFNQEDPAALGRMLTYYDYFNRARVERIGEIDRQAREIATIEQAITQESDALEQTRADQRREMQTLTESRAARRQILVKLDAEIRTKEQQLASLMRDERNLAELVSRLREVVRDLPVDLPDNVPFSRLKGKLPWPVQGKLAARYGANRKAESLTWRGVVIDAEEGREVKAIYNGRVVFADWMRGFGLLLIVDHGNGYMSLYGHNQSLYKNVGDVVRKGEAVATVGNSGGRETPGLYFEIRHNGVPDNPVLWCRAGSR
jgi:septal ring factor EnvC (AmiA/AmiB activator)